MKGWTAMIFLFEDYGMVVGATDRIRNSTIGNGESLNPPAVDVLYDLNSFRRRTWMTSILTVKSCNLTGTGSETSYRPLKQPQSLLQLHTL